MNRILALVPGYNEEAGIAGVVEGVRPHLPVLVIDDGSRDETSARARSAGAEVIRQEPNQGKGVALRTGFSLALEQGYDGILTLDADGQHDPSEIPLFLERFRETNADLIIGARDFSKMPLVRRVSNTFARTSFSWVVGQSIADNQSGYRLIGRALLEKLKDSDEMGFEFEVEMIVTCVRDRMRLEWVPISTIYGDEESHINPWQHTVSFLRILRKAHAMMRG